MKWGRRKGSSDSRSASKLKTRKGSPRTLSNKQLEQANKRMQLEKTFKKHKKRDFSGAKKVLSGVMQFIGGFTISAVIVDTTYGGNWSAQNLMKKLVK